MACLLVLLSCLLLPAALQAQGGATEDQLKAAFLLKFPAYVEWSNSTFSASDSPLVIGVLDTGQIAANIELLSPGLVINGHPVQIRRLQPDDVVDDLRVLFVGSELTAQAASMLARALANSVLTVTESTTTRSPDSVINFVIDANRVRFDVALSRAEQNGLQLSSRLLQVAQNVVVEEQP